MLTSTLRNPLVSAMRPGSQHRGHRDLGQPVRNALLLRLRLIQAHAGKFRIGEEAGWHLPSRGCPLSAGKIVADDAEVVERDMGKERTTGAVAERPNPGSAGLQPVIYLDKSFWGGFDSSQFKANAFLYWVSGRSLPEGANLRR